MLRAIARMDPRYRPAVVVGGKPLNNRESVYLAELKSLAVDLALNERCFFLGEVTPNRFFSIIDIFCHTYLGEEALGFVILEAMSTKCPVIAVNRGGPLEMIEDQVSGQLVPPDDPEKLARAIEKYIADPQFADRAAARGLDNIKERFDFAQWPTAWLDLLQRTIG